MPAVPVDTPQRTTPLRLTASRVGPAAAGQAVPNIKQAPTTKPAREIRASNRLCAMASSLVNTRRGDGTFRSLISIERRAQILDLS